MSSILKVDTIQDQSGNNIISEAANVITIGASGDTITVPAGATVSGFTSAGIDDNATSTAITISSDEDVTFTEDILLGDNKKAIFGAGSDLQIFHDGSNSYISDTATGDLRIRGSSAIKLEDNNGSETFAIFNDDGAVDLYHNNVKKFETTSAGATITGTAKVSSASSGVTPNANADELFVEGSGNSGITIGSGTADAGQLCFGDSGDNDIGAIAYLHDVNAMRFTISGTERARFLGNTFMVGKTAGSGATNGVELKSNDESRFTQTDRTVVAINRLSSDGNIVEFKKDNTTVGSIGNSSADFFITNSTATNGAGILLQNNLFVNPMKGGSADTSSAVSLGNSSRKWKDIYLGGGIYLGGTGTSNKLDDYEEGTFTPAFGGGASGSGYDHQVGAYTKVGNLCFFQIQLDGNGLGATTAQVTITGLPFTSASSSSAYGGATINFSGNFKSDGDITAHVGASQTTIYLFQFSGSNLLGTEATNINGGLLLNGYYRTT